MSRVRVPPSLPAERPARDARHAHTGRCLLTSRRWTLLLAAACLTAGCGEDRDAPRELAALPDEGTFELVLDSQLSDRLRSRVAAHGRVPVSGPVLSGRLELEAVGAPSGMVLEVWTREEVPSSHGTRRGSTFHRLTLERPSEHGLGVRVEHVEEHPDTRQRTATPLEPLWARVATSRLDWSEPGPIPVSFAIGVLTRSGDRGWFEGQYVLW